MTALKTAESTRFLEDPDARYPVVLIFGRDAGGVAERADALVSRLTRGNEDPFALLRLDGDELSADPARLADEANTIGLFGGKRVIRVRVGAKPLHKAVEPLIVTPPRDSVVILEAGDLTKSSPLRTAVERAKNAVAIACYLDERQEINRLIDQELAAAGLRIDPDARALLTAEIGGDRLASRSEIAKVATYALGDGSISVNHVVAVAGNVADTALDDLIDAAFSGDRGKVITLTARLLADGNRPDALLATALRHAMLLTQLTAKVAAGASVDTVVRDGVRFFRRQPVVQRQVERWVAAGAIAAMVAIGRASASIRSRPAVSALLTERCLLSISQFASGARDVG